MRLKKQKRKKKEMENNIQELRKKNNITQEELAEALEVSRQTINAIENGKYCPTLKLAFKIAKYFNKKVEEVFIYDE